MQFAETPNENYRRGGTSSGSPDVAKELKAASQFPSRPNSACKRGSASNTNLESHRFCVFKNNLGVL